MAKSPQAKKVRSIAKVNVPKQFIFLALGWSFITLSIMGVDMRNTWLKSIESGKLQAQIAIQKDIQYRHWNSRIGGIYAIISDSVQPNPYLYHPDKIITTESGEKLTLIDPAYMARQADDLVYKNSFLYGHLTSLEPIRPDNKPDAWEEEGLGQFNNGSKEISHLETVEGVNYLRLMQPLYIEKSCLKCHVNQGYAIGDVRGGLSVRIPMTKMRTLAKKHLLEDYLLYLGVWLIGLLGLGLGAKRLHKQITTQQEVETALSDFKASLDNIDEAVFMFDANNMKLFYSNKGGEVLMGAKAEEMTGKTLPEFLAKERQADLYITLKPLFNLKKESILFETLFDNNKDHEIPVEINIAYVVPRKNEERFLVVVRDITERDEAQKEKEVIQAQLLQVQKLESVGQLAAGIAHEINTPIQFLSTNVEFFDEAFQDISTALNRFEEKSEKGTLDSEIIKNTLDEADWDYLRDEVPNALKQSKAGLSSVSSIVLAMKEFSHPGGKDKVLEDINKIITITLTVSRNEYKYVTEVKTDLDETISKVPCLRDELGQVLLNLITNGAHAISSRKEKNPDETVAHSMAISTRQIEGFVEILISDTGGGIPEDIQLKIFDPFFTTKEVGKGTGQGLAISKDVIEIKLDGSLTFDTEIGKGTTFSIKLPLE